MISEMNPSLQWYFCVLVRSETTSCRQPQRYLGDQTMWYHQPYSLGGGWAHDCSWTSVSDVRKEDIIWKAFWCNKNDEVPLALRLLFCRCWSPLRAAMMWTIGRLASDVRQVKYIHTSIHTYMHPYIHPSIHTYIHTYNHAFSWSWRPRCAMRWARWPASGNSRRWSPATKTPWLASGGELRWTCQTQPENFPTQEWKHVIFSGGWPVSGANISEVGSHHVVLSDFLPAKSDNTYTILGDNGHITSCHTFSTRLISPPHHPPDLFHPPPPDPPPNCLP